MKQGKKNNRLRLNLDKERVKRILVYASKCTVGALIVVLLSKSLHYEDYIWCLISVMLVLSPDGSDAMSLAITRIKANIVGAISGLSMLYLHQDKIIMLCFAIIITVALCNLLKLEVATRTALAATIIVMTHPTGPHVYDASVERVLSVLVGCSIGLLITFAFHNKYILKPVEHTKDSNEA
ncbi:hypothetical protein COR50_15140 [Chitinophaga caeni]|uniref:Integral membrane bound transporter domain-containing protein n=1 Tax=Chitinophaga caeni TaxID=2029983 RepID=A0A291QWT2_9BACT|nr:FUSC family protein [Chitinophaga caeni]ATL48390.1 hypothetical protein COR50_15140 [Chitinophaga caeni]